MPPDATRRLAYRYGIALLAVAAAALLRWALQPILGATPPYNTFFLAVVVAAAAGGLGPGLLATAAGAITGIVLALRPTTQPLAQPLMLNTAAEQVRLLIYLASGVGISLIAESMYRARRELKAEAEALREKSEELRQANEKLREMQEAKDRFLAVVSHELRNPLMPIAHNLHFLERAPAGAPEHREAMAIIQRQVEQLTRLVNDLLDVTRLGHNQLHLQKKPIDLREVVSATMEDHRAAFAQRGVDVVLALPDVPARVMGDVSRLSQILSNLLQNAAKFTSPGGKVEVVLEKRGSQAVLRVRDDGVGIPPDALDRVFEPFTQLRADTPGGGPRGLGLGLAVARSLAELHEGTLEATSQGADRGTQFTLTLPLEAAQVTAQ
ncbi:MAG TPA: HAMP domain-containing sensor histidine kinase [Burkholderiales bacterium]|nr:HAMP domain-containing sensor histidine kinase [Burkholderiales bacterium]